MQIIPLTDKIVIEVIEEEKTTQSGIVLPDAAVKGKSQRGKVIAVGDGRTLENGEKEKINVEENDIIIFSKNCGNDVKIEGKEYKILSMREVLCKINN